VSEADRIEIACAARRDYLPHTATMLASAQANAGARIRAHLLVGDDVTDDELSLLGTMLEEGESELVPHRIEAHRFAGLTTTGSLPTAHWYRTLLPELLELPRALYLDSDLLVLDRLTPLWKLDLGKHFLAAVTNIFPDPETAAAYCESLGVDADSYFNSGVMVLDLGELRDFASFERVREFTTSSPTTLILPEQDAMNAVLGEYRLPLHPRWNLMTGLLRLPHAETAFDRALLAEAREAPAIRHFEGSANKPWQPEAPDAEREQWAAYARGVPDLRGRGRRPR
jgi:lipopolysaccharide biosynthesis glycosyltransferase